MARHRILSPRVAGSVVALAAFAFDQIAKWLVAYPFELRQRGVIEVLPVFNLRWAGNLGVSFSLFSTDAPLGRWLLLAITVAIAIAITAWLWCNDRTAKAIALGLILGGALGNIIDRLRLGYVVDFLDLHIGGWRPFQIFNTADCMISIGVAALLLQSIFVDDMKSGPKPVRGQW